MEEFLESWGTLGVFLGILATGLGFPMPEELPVVVGGLLVGTGKAYWWAMLPACIVGVIIGDSFLYFIGRFWGSKLLASPFIRKRLLPPERLEKISENFKKYGVKILLFARLTPGIRAPIFLFAGISKLPLIRFLIADGIYAVPGVTFLWFLGYLFGDSVVGFFQHEAARIKYIIFGVLILAVAAYLVYKFMKKPMITGDPHEMPKLVEQVTDKIDQASKMIRPTDKGAHPAPAARAESPAPESKIEKT